jgi:lipooligosaccharide transport system permease protein
METIVATVVVPPAAPTYATVGRAFNYWLAQYRRTWRGTAISTVLQPVGFLVAMGLGLGALVDHGAHSSSLSGASYLAFIAPGLLAAQAMQAAAFESTWPVLGAVKWQRQYFAQLATPLRPVDILCGHLLFVALRLAITSTAFLIVMVLFRATPSAWAVLTLPAAVLTGLAYATPIFAFSVSRDDPTGFAMLFRFGIVPMFLFSGTFFPISQLPGVLQPVAWVVPLWHGVDLCRSLALGQATIGSTAVHVLYLSVWVVGGFFLALRCFRRRLEK